MIPLKKTAIVLAAVLMLSALAAGCDPDNNDIPEITETGGVTSETTLHVTEISETTEMPEEPLGQPEGFSSRYGYYQLNKEQKRVYDKLSAAARNFETEVELDGNLTKENLKRICELMNLEENDLYYLADSYQYNYDKETHVVSSVTLYYRYDKEKVAELDRATEEAADRIFERITPEMTDLEKVKVFHDQIIWGTYYTLFGDYITTPYGALAEGKALCEGYARAFAYLCNRAEIENCFSTGFDNETGEKHIWNMVKLNGNWYNIDTTWDDPQGTRPPSVIYNYYLLRDADLPDTLVVDGNLFTRPLTLSDEYNYFKYYGLYATSYQNARAILSREIKNSYTYKSKYVYLQFSNEQLYKEAIYLLFTERGGAQIYDYEITPAEYNVNHYNLLRDDKSFTITLEPFYGE